VILREHDIPRLFRFLRSRGWSRAAIAAATGLAETRVREIYHGRQHVTSYDVLERIASGLSIDRGLLGLAYSGTGPATALACASATNEAADPSGYKDFVGALAAMAVRSPPDDISHLLPAPPALPAQDVPPLVMPSHVAVLREVCDRHRRFDADQGGGSCRDSAAAYLRWALGMRASRFDSDTTERDVIAALSDMHQVVGWASHDLGDHAAARRHLIAGLALARASDDLVLISGAFYRLGRISIHQGRAKEALKLWQLGQIVAQDSGCLVSVAVLNANEAWAYAMLGAADRVCDALARAKGELSRVDAATVPSWARFFLAPADLDGISAVAYGCLASHPEHRSRYAQAVIEHADRAVGLRQRGEHRSRIFDTISLTTGYLLDDQPAQVDQYGHEALDMAATATSARATDRLLGMARLMPSRPAHSGVAGVLQRIGSLARPLA
jgi:transcriptional regulator with XRE-family HTH domain